MPRRLTRPWERMFSPLSPHRPTASTGIQAAHSWVSCGELGPYAHTIPRGLTRPVGAHVFPALSLQAHGVDGDSGCAQLGEFW